MAEDRIAATQPRPMLSVVRGEPTAAEVAAVVVVLSARAGRAGHTTAGPQRTEWSARERMMRPHLSAGPGAWRASGLPRF